MPVSAPNPRVKSKAERNPENGIAKHGAYAQKHATRALDFYVFQYSAVMLFLACGVCDALFSSCKFVQFVSRRPLRPVVPVSSVVSG